MKFEVIERIPAEVIHFFESSTGVLICSTGSKLRIRTGTSTHEFELPVGLPFRTVMPSRMARRALRLDKMNAVFTADRRAVIAIYQGQISRCDLATNEVRRTGRLRQCRNVLHCGVCVTPEGHICFGEYGANPKRESVPIWMSVDDGNSWEVVFEFPAGSIKHIHGVYHDPYSGRLLVPTGDFEGECFLYDADTRFSDVRRYGDGTQAWRPVSLFIERDHLVWGMDSQLETSFLQVFDRRTKTLTRGCDFPGPIWYSKALEGVSVLQTTCETGPGVRSDSAHLFASKDNRSWVEVAKFRKDPWPVRYFKSGVIAFADGVQTPDRFALFGEALVGFDGVSFIGALH
jgi:hypothetical protein